MGLLQRIEQARAADVARTERRYSADAWFSDYLVPSMNQWGYNGYNGLTTTWVNGKVQEYSATLPGHSAAVRNSPPAFAAQMVRALVISQMRFTFRNLPSSNSPRKMFGTNALAPLERPWRNATTGELVSRMEWHAGLAGNSFVTNYWPGRLRVLRPDWVAIVYGSQREPEDAAHALDGEILGYAYINGGMASMGRNEVTVLLPEEVAHWSPIPDPEGAGIGMSWVSAAMRDIVGDKAATDHKVLFFENGATPNLVIKGITATTKEQFDRIVEGLEQRHAGFANAYKTLYLTAGADATVVGSDLKQLDFKATQGAGETRIAMLARVPAPLLGISEGLAGSSLNAGNFGMARRIFADSWIYPTMQDLAAALAPLVKVPSGAELWFDTADMPILREDAKDAAEIEDIKASTINKHITAGFTPDSAVAAVRGQDISLLKHSGLVSVQLQPPGTQPKPVAAGGVGPKAPAVTAARAQEPDDFDDDEAVEALIQALASFDNPSERSFNEALHPRNPKGGPGGGRFRSLVDRIIDAIKGHKGDGDPFDGFDREQLRKVAVKRGIKLDRGEPRDSIAKKLLADLGHGSTSHESSFDSKNAATGLDALDAAPSRARLLWEASLSPKKRQEFHRKLETLNDEQVFKLGGAGPRTTLAADQQITTAEKSKMAAATDAYMREAYFDINGALHAAGDGPLPANTSKEVSGQIADIDQFLTLGQLNADAILYRGTRLEGDPPNELFNPGFSSTSADWGIARDFGRGSYMGINTGSTDRPGVPTVIEIQAPKGTPAAQMSPYHVAAEVLLKRGLRLRLVEDKGMFDGVRHLVYRFVS